MRHIQKRTHEARHGPGKTALAALLALVCHTPNASAASPPAAASSLLPADIRAAGVLTLATDAHHPPCESFADDNETMVGFEPDIWNAIGAKLGVKIAAVSIDFDGLIPGVQSGRYNLAMECMSDDTQREKQVTFIDYAYATAVVYELESTASATSDPLSLCGRRAGAQIGTDFVASLEHVSQACVTHGKAPVVIQQFPSNATVLLALYAQRVDFMLNDLDAVSELKKNAPAPLKVTDIGFPLFVIGAVVKTGDTQLANALLAALQELHTDGQYTAIMKKWDISSLALKAPGINLAATR
jgi:polar amino acid transport system substrate-binding protein